MPYPTELAQHLQISEFLELLPFFSPPEKLSPDQVLANLDQEDPILDEHQNELNTVREKFDVGVEQKAFYNKNGSREQFVNYVREHVLNQQAISRQAILRKDIRGQYRQMVQYENGEIPFNWEVLAHVLYEAQPYLVSKLARLNPTQQESINPTLLAVIQKLDTLKSKPYDEIKWQLIALACDVEPFANELMILFSKPYLETRAGLELAEWYGMHNLEKQMNTLQENEEATYIIASPGSNLRGTIQLYNWSHVNTAKRTNDSIDVQIVHIKDDSNLNQYRNGVQELTEQKTLGTTASQLVSQPIQTEKRIDKIVSKITGKSLESLKNANFIFDFAIDLHIPKIEYLVNLQRNPDSKTSDIQNFLNTLDITIANTFNISYELVKELSTYSSNQDFQKILRDNQGKIKFLSQESNYSKYKVQDFIENVVKRQHPSNRGITAVYQLPPAFFATLQFAQAGLLQGSGCGFSRPVSFDLGFNNPLFGFNNTFSQYAMGLSYSPFGFYNSYQYGFETLNPYEQFYNSPFGYNAPYMGLGFSGEGIDMANFMSPFGQIYQQPEPEKKGFKCPNCEGWIDGGDTCPHCKITKQEWAAKTGVSCA